MAPFDEQTLQKLINELVQKIVLLDAKYNLPSNMGPVKSSSKSGNSPQTHKYNYEGFANKSTSGLNYSSPGFDAALARLIDHTLLKPDATQEKVIQLCQEARQFNFASVCVNSAYTKLCAEFLKDTPVKVCTHIGFPLGATLPEV